LPAEHVLADIRAQVAMGAHHITFGDPDFFNGPTHAMRITRALHTEFPHLTFDATIKIEHLLRYQHLLPELRENGCVFIVSAVESLNPDVLKHLAKGHTRDDVALAFRLLSEVGIALRPSLLPFSPWETLESYLEMLDFFAEQRLIEHVDPVHYSIRLLIPPGSAILEEAGNKTWLGDLDPASYSYHWRHPDPRMDDLHSEISALVERAQTAQLDVVDTFFQVQALAFQAAGHVYDLPEAIASYGQQKVLPHLTESWFC
jgi:hypothetical protein